MEPNQSPKKSEGNRSNPKPDEEEVTGGVVPRGTPKSAPVRHGFARYEVQFELPVNNPLMGVAKRRHKGGTTFYVPINHPRAHTMGYMELVEAADTSGLVRLTDTP